MRTHVFVDGSLIHLRERIQLEVAALKDETDGLILITWGIVFLRPALLTKNWYLNASECRA